MKAKTYAVDETDFVYLTGEEARKARCKLLRILREDEYHDPFYKDFRADYVKLRRWKNTGKISKTSINT